MVMVTTAVYGFLYLLNQVFKCPHWAGLTDYTSPFGFAIGYVFKKQSEILGFCDLAFLLLDKYFSKVTTSICRIH